MPIDETTPTILPPTIIPELKRHFDLTFPDAYLRSCTGDLDRVPAP